MRSLRTSSCAARSLLLGATLALTVGALGNGCGHAKTVGPVTPDAEKAATTEPSGEHADSIESRRTSDLKGPHGQPENISIVSSPALLLKPGAARSLQERLSRDGALRGDVGDQLDGRTRDALTRFQRAHDLPATGIPDDATVRKLGLKPEDIFRSGTGS